MKKSKWERKRDDRNHTRTASGQFPCPCMTFGSPNHQELTRVWDVRLRRRFRDEPTHDNERGEEGEEDVRGPQRRDTPSTLSSDTSHHGLPPTMMKSQTNQMGRGRGRGENGTRPYTIEGSSFTCCPHHGVPLIKKSRISQLGRVREGGEARPYTTFTPCPKGTPHHGISLTTKPRIGQLGRVGGDEARPYTIEGGRFTSCPKETSCHGISLTTKPRIGQLGRVEGDEARPCTIEGNRFTSCPKETSRHGISLAIKSRIGHVGRVGEDEARPYTIEGTSFMPCPRELLRHGFSLATKSQIGHMGRVGEDEARPYKIKGNSLTSCPKETSHHGITLTTKSRIGQLGGAGEDEARQRCESNKIMYPSAYFPKKEALRGMKLRTYQMGSRVCRSLANCFRPLNLVQIRTARATIPTDRLGYPATNVVVPRCFQFHSQVISRRNFQDGRSPSEAKYEPPSHEDEDGASPQSIHERRTSFGKEGNHGGDQLRREHLDSPQLHSGREGRAPRFFPKEEVSHRGKEFDGCGGYSKGEEQFGGSPGFRSQPTRGDGETFYSNSPPSPKLGYFGNVRRRTTHPQVGQQVGDENPQESHQFGRSPGFRCQPTIDGGGTDLETLYSNSPPSPKLGFGNVRRRTTHSQVGHQVGDENSQEGHQFGRRPGFRCQPTIDGGGADLEALYSNSPPSPKLGFDNRTTNPQVAQQVGDAALGFVQGDDNARKFRDVPERESDCRISEGGATIARRPNSLEVDEKFVRHLFGTDYDVTTRNYRRFDDRVQRILNYDITDLLLDRAGFASPKGTSSSGPVRSDESSEETPELRFQHTLDSLQKKIHKWKVTTKAPPSNF